MQGKGTFISPFHRPRCLAAAAPAGKAKLTHPGKAILAGRFITICLTEKSRVCQNVTVYSRKSGINVSDSLSLSSLFLVRSRAKKRNK